MITTISRLFLVFLFPLLFGGIAAAQMRVEHFVRVKGQEPTQIRALGIVSGLNGTGDDLKSYTPTAFAKLRQLSRSGMSIVDEKGIQGSKNNAYVEVTVTIPGVGARNGDILDCTVVAVGNATSLRGGVLSMTALSTPLQQDENALPFGLASGNVTIEDASAPNVGRVVNGCRITADFQNPYVRDGLITLVLKPQHARPKMALAIEESLNTNNPEFEAEGIAPAKAINSNYVIVQMPASKYLDPMDFIASILDTEVMDPPVGLPRVIINERSGTIAIDQDVEVKPTLVTHRNFVANIEPELAPGEQEQFPRQFLDMDTATRFRQMNGEDVMNVKLKSLQASMNALQAAPQDIIDVIKILHFQGAIIGDVVFVD